MRPLDRCQQADAGSEFPVRFCGLRISYRPRIERSETASDDESCPIAFARSSRPRAIRANLSVSGGIARSPKQQAFLDFVLSHYVAVGVEELDLEKLTPLLRLKYHNSIADAVDDVGQDIGKAFAGFQRFLYQDAVTPP